MRRRAVEGFGGRVRRAAFASGCAGALLFGLASGAAATGPTGPIPPGADPDTTWAVVREADGDVAVVHGEEALQAAAADALDRSDVDVLSLETDVPVHALGTNDPLRAQQWPLDQTSYEATWPTTRGGGVVVAVIDTGVRADHEDLAGAVLPGLDLVAPGDGRIDPHGHGTHVAGIIAAAANNGRGVAGAAPDARILPIRVLDATGAGNASKVATGIVWAVQHGARVVNLSLGGTVPSDGLLEAVDYATANGVLVVAAGGNGGAGGAAVYPAAFAPALAVSAVDAFRARASFSTAGAYIDVAAPGVGIVSTYGSAPDAYASANGTSMATPYASAAAALVFAANPALTADQARTLVEQAAIDLGGPGRDPEFGFGLVDPRLAANRARALLDPGSAGGYRVVGHDGRVRSFGTAADHGDLAGRALSAPIVASASTPSGNGYWLAGADGAVYAFGDAAFLGSMSGVTLNGRIVGMAATPTGRGYVLLGSDGGIFTFGDAGFYGSTGGLRLNAPVLDLALSPSGRGYWFVGADGGVFAFGDAAFHGSTGGMRLAAPVMSMTTGSGGSGYWTIATDGGVFAFGVPFHGSLPQLRANGLYLLQVPALRLRATSNGTGYYVLGADGSVFAFGAAPFRGSAPGLQAVDLVLTS
jgi:type VII secretion-associated serine protease mycosin